ncbi:hypothetical protein PPROV_000221100 [Pycnococcus provasolii]|uniref:Uncharacterized protein n=1 Tax=Pycnococcus provasolii TaxID=41880 RepID=A0A830H873_9CHLO|nr:hypothetical protein PPROV_000221100 [Pycnococcus provasolii]
MASLPETEARRVVDVLRRRRNELQVQALQAHNAVLSAETAFVQDFCTGTAASQAFAPFATTPKMFSSASPHATLPPPPPAAQRKETPVLAPSPGTAIPPPPPPGVALPPAPNVGT